MSETCHINIVFDCEAVIKNCLLPMGLLEKAEGGSISICFTVDFVEICTTTKRGRVLVGIQIIDKDVTRPRTKWKLFNNKISLDDRNGWGFMQKNFIVYSSKLCCW